MTPKLVIFDCDGVLVDSEPVGNKVMADFLSERGYPITPEACHKRFMGRPLTFIMDEVRALGVEIEEDWRDIFYERQQGALKAGVPMIEGVLEVLDAIDAAGIKRAVVSNGQMTKMELTMGPLGLIERFEGRIYHPESDAVAKPAPDMFWRAAKQAGVAPEDCVMIDDSPAGCNGAANAGMRCLGYAEVSDPEQLAACGAIPVRSMKEVLVQLGLSA